MEAEAPQPLTDSAPAKRKNPRRRPLGTFCVSFTTLAQIAFSKSQETDGRVGWMMKMMGSLVGPFFPLLHIIQHLWLAELYLIDKFIIASENLIQAAFPPSAHLFDKIDEFLEVVEVLPSISRDGLDSFPMIIRQSPLLEYAASHLSSWLKIFLSLWISEDAKEKEIPMDTSYTEPGAGCASIEEPLESIKSPGHPKIETFEKFYEASSDEVGAEKEALEKDAELEKEEREILEEEGIGEEEDGAATKKSEGGIDNPILELFDSSWHMTVSKKR